MNAIQEELELAKGKMLKEMDYCGRKLVCLTRDNVAIVEAMIRNDSAYILSSDKNAKPVNKNGKQKYGGSSAYWMSLLKKVLLSNESENEYSYEEIIKYAVESVDRENSTHLNADGHGRSEITDRLKKFNREELIECLKNPDYKEMKLVKEIAKKTSAEKKPRENISFASKFCHYACFYIFEGTDYQDNYSIYDNILRKALPLYLDYYEIREQYDLKDYGQYRNAVDAIRKKSGIKTGTEISRNGFDHLLWYYHKGRMKFDSNNA
ncbi:MAG: hypothetical protein IKZ88_00785 [Neisseriaceae bacterium]|nr:hypothetical protein [Neisseriaceae bacterium]